ncbi:hypothetical protein A6A08_02730 [Nocardiopsis sp. TSRI0078]|nr:hypothetical protein A6A08_02730 [Nocardiopsis sp. TSRI0078]
MPLKSAAAVLAAALLCAPSPASALARDTAGTTSVSETEILITNDHEVLEVGPEGDVESVDAYLEQTYSEDELSTLDTGYGYLTNGRLRIVATGCSRATVDYTKYSGSSITVNFRVRYANGGQTAPSAWKTVSSSASASFNLASVQHVRGVMRLVNGAEYHTELVRCN